MHAVIIAQLPIRSYNVDRMCGINLLTATFQNEIKSTDPRYRPYDDSVMPCYMTTLFYRGRLFDDQG